MVKYYIEQESGRSMVEMLGVLAIIGVLSVGGISGYTTAMNKHKANEILNAAAVRAMAVSTQLQSGTPIGSVSLGEFDNENNVGGATFAAGVTDAGNNRFTIGFANNGKPSDAVLAQMQNIAGTDGIVRDLTGTGITYNNDLTADKIASDYKSQPTCEVEGANRKWCTDTCVAGNTCPSTGPSCPGNSSANEITGGVSFTITENGETITCYCPEGQSLQNNTCKPAPTTACTHYDTNECGLGYYCRFKDVTGLDCYADSAGQPIDGSSQAVQGTCTPITNALKNEATGKWYYSNEYLDWFSAYSWCKGKGRPGLITFSTLTAIARTKNATADVKSGYNGSSLDYPLYNAFGGATGSFPQDAYWVNTCTKTTSGCNTDSCDAYYVYVFSNGEYVGSSARSYYDFYALCE